MYQCNDRNAMSHVVELVLDREMEWLAKLDFVRIFRKGI
jgi:hypothetical protein